MRWNKMLVLPLCGMMGAVIAGSSPVPVATSANRLVFTVINSGKTTLEGVRVAVKEAPDWLDFPVPETDIGTIPPGETGEAVFVFGVTANESGPEGTLDLRVLDRQGLCLGTKRLGFVAIAGAEGANLGAPYPNPANLSLTIPFVLTEPAGVTLMVYDLLGREIRRLFQGNKPAGRREILWDGRDRSGRTVPSGAYLIHLEITDSRGVRSFTRKALIQK